MMINQRAFSQLEGMMINQRTWLLDWISFGLEFGLEFKFLKGLIEKNGQQTNNTENLNLYK